MQSIAEQIHQADSQPYTHTMRKLIEWMWEREKLEFAGYLNSTGAIDIAKEIFGIDSFEVKNGVQDIYIPPQAQLYVGSQRDTGWIEMDNLSRKELEFLLQAFFGNESNRDYIIDLIFHKNNFIKKTQWDILDYLQRVELLFQKVGNPKKKILKIVTSEVSEYPESANDDFFIPILERIKNIEPGYFNYADQVYRIQIDYVESLFCETIASLAEEHKNHIWALDPNNNEIYIPERLRNKISLIQSICELHNLMKPDFPMLHNLVESTLASWILVYRWFSAPTHSIRQILWEDR
mgnify:FL=1